MNKTQIKRIYDDPAQSDGYRILVDRIWPRGISKERAMLDDWIKDIAPSNKLRKWFDHDPEKFEEFEKKYRIELKEKEKELKELREKAKEKTLSLLYGAKDTTHNQAIVLQKVLEECH
ncbi:hypothetical protein KCTC52924_02846 [Arenibacter antarcticus]|uniref:DUF488 domain-containing protein n=1 Tax=Arenibacter antarcticus TaxID=2040469 RepID=A0ABW5VG21_9FLAO|nr:DUF488 family protein [Arenibacter sp. H213]MCM4167265.1 DUF488 domain-containing protein [Arenibacter sp. H213]